MNELEKIMRIICSALYSDEYMCVVFISSVFLKNTNK